MPRTNAVLPAPSVPESSTTSPAERRAASSPASASVAASDSVIDAVGIRPWPCRSGGRATR